MNLKELAGMLGLSPTTVSRALNGYPEVSEKTRLRVKRAALENNYTPSQTARGLATGKTGAIGHVIPLGRHRMINPHYADFIAGAGYCYARLGYDIVMTIVEPGDEHAAYTRLSRSNKVDGFVVTGPLVEDARINLLQDIGMPFVVHGRAAGGGTLGTRDYSWLDVNNLDAFERATRYLLDLGHRRIALLNGLEHMSFAYLRRKGFEAGMMSKQVEIDPELMFSEDMSEAYGFEVAHRLLALKDRPTAILTSSRLMATGAQRAIAEVGLKIGTEISLLTHDDQFAFIGSQATIPSITCVRSSLYDAGMRVAELIAKLVENPTLPPIQELWEAELVIGRSTGPAP